jgi:hypothetical protein
MRPYTPPKEGELSAITIDPEFESLCPPLSEAEFDQLKRSVEAAGCRDPLVVWKGKGILIDGHNRYRICKESGVEFGVVEMRFISRDSARNYIILNQLGRRNLSPDAAAILRGKLHNARKMERGGDRKSEVAESKGHNDPLIPSTAAKVAAETGVSEPTVKRDAAFASACDKIGITADVISGKIKPVRKQVIAAAKGLPKEPTREQVAEAAKKAVEPPKKEDQPVFRDLVIDGLKKLLSKFKDRREDAIQIIRENVQ